VAETISIWAHRMGLARPHLRTDAKPEKIITNQ
jgi:hypothetical protein